MAQSVGRSERHGNSAFGRRLVLAFVVFHVVCITLFAIPVDGRPLDMLRKILSPYMRCIGMNETWNTFSPNPKASEQFMKALVVTVRGKTEVYSFPRMENLSFTERYRQERYRKFVESVLCPDCAGLWPDIERAVARREGTPLDPPDKVILVKFESPIDPKRGLLGEDRHAKPTALSEIFIQPKDLQ